MIGLCYDSVRFMMQVKYSNYLNIKNNRDEIIRFFEYFDYLFNSIYENKKTRRKSYERRIFASIALTAFAIIDNGIVEPYLEFLDRIYNEYVYSIENPTNLHYI